MMKAGKYWVGDLCYVIRDEDWCEVCNLMFDNSDDNSSPSGGEFQLKDGTKFALMSTKYGDGTYHDQDGRKYGVDAGVIGCILVEDIKKHSNTYTQGGNAIDFPEDFEVTYDDGIINFGNLVVINTDEEEDHVYGPEYHDDEGDDYYDKEDVDIEEDE